LVTHRTVWVKDDGDGIPEKNEIKGGFRSFGLNIFTVFDTFLLNDDKPSIVHARSCFNLAPETRWSIGASLLRRGAVVFVGHARIDCDGDYFPPFNFTKNLISDTERCGDAFYKAQINYVEDLSNWIEIFKEWDNPLFSLLYDLIATSFYGDPATKMHTQI
jgi:hypothetical protein